MPAKDDQRRGGVRFEGPEKERSTWGSVRTAPPRRATPSRHSSTSVTVSRGTVLAVSGVKHREVIANPDFWSTRIDG